MFNSQSLDQADNEFRSAWSLVQSSQQDTVQILESLANIFAVVSLLLWIQHLEGH